MRPITHSPLDCLFLASSAAALAALLAISLSPRMARAADDFSFIQISDTHLDGAETPTSHAGKMQERLREIAALKPTPAFIVDTGDITENGTKAQFASFQRAVSADLPPTLPLYVAPGNHDVRWNPPAGDVFLAESGQPRFRSWDYGGVHFVLLDSTVPLEHWGHIDQAQLDWLARDLKKIGTTTPVVVGFHHWVGRESVMVDNEDAFLSLVAPYNVRLFLLGHGHANVLWNINGVPAIMTGALFDGSYSIVRVHGNTLDIYRRTVADPNPARPFLSESLARPGSPNIAATAKATDGELKVNVQRGDLPKDAVVSCRLDDARAVAIEPVAPLPEGRKDIAWSTGLPLGGVVPGIHRLLILAKYPDGREYRLPMALALTAPDGVKPTWTATLDGAVQGGSLSDGSTVYVPTMGGSLYALDAKTGTTRWRYQTSGCLFSAPVLGSDTLYFGSGDGNVQAIDRKTGKPLWKTPLGAPVLSGLTLAGKVLCAAVADGTVAGLDTNNGRVLWHTPSGGGMYQSRPATDGTRYFLGDWDNNFRCLDAATGSELWKIKIGRSFYYSASIGAPTLNADNSLVYVSSDDGVLHALDTKTGAEMWKVNGPKLGYSGPLFQEGHVYNASLTDTGQVFAFDAATGKKQWEATTGSVIYDSSCRAGGDDIYIGSVDGTLSAIHKTNGTLDWQYHLPPGHLLASPETDAEQVYVGNLSGQFMAFPLQKPGQ